MRNIIIFLNQDLDPTRAWYDEIEFYDWNNPGFLLNTENFTQLVWKNSLEVGFGIAIGSNNKVIACANYFPAGNKANEYEINVSRPFFESAIESASTDNYFSVRIRSSSYMLIWTINI